MIPVEVGAAVGQVVLVPSQVVIVYVHVFVWLLKLRALLLSLICAFYNTARTFFCHWYTFVYVFTCHSYTFCPILRAPFPVTHVHSYTSLAACQSYTFCLILCASFPVTDTRSLRHWLPASYQKGAVTSVNIVRTADFSDDDSRPPPAENVRDDEDVQFSNIPTDHFFTGVTVLSAVLPHCNPYLGERDMDILNASWEPR